MVRLHLKKQNKLCSVIAIDALFSRGSGTDSVLAYPLRAIWRVNHSRKADITTPKFFISVPKRRIRHAVDRVTVRRRVRESYRLSRNELLEGIEAPVDIAFVYVADIPQPYSKIDRSLKKILQKIAETVGYGADTAEAGNEKSEKGETEK